MARYEREHRLVDLSLVPVIPMPAKESVVRDTETGAEGRGLSWDSYREADQRAWDNLQQNISEH